MGQELEIKLRIKNEEALLTVLGGSEIRSRASSWSKITMKTAYYDTPSCSLSVQKWMLRQRSEGSRSVVCFKMPLDGHLRGEWEVEAPAPDRAALEALVRSGAPEALIALCSEGLVPVCGAEYVRTCTVLRFSDGSEAELAGDCGILHGRHTQLPFTELELELSAGEPEAMLAFAQTLMQRYTLREEPMSKFARARLLK